MLKNLQQKREHEGGFTLIELLIVIVILGILAAIVVFSVAGVTSKGSAASCSSTVKAVDVAAEAMYAQTGTGAATIGGLVSGGFLHADANFATTSGVTVGPIGTGTGAYTITFTPPATGNLAGNADATTCPAS